MNALRAKVFANPASARAGFRKAVVIPIPNRRTLDRIHLEVGILSIAHHIKAMECYIKRTSEVNRQTVKPNQTRSQGHRAHVAPSKSAKTRKKYLG